jgi:hypothetical protein
MSAAEPAKPIVASWSDFCQGFFHMDACFEWQQKEVCLCVDVDEWKARKIEARMTGSVSEEVIRTWKRPCFRSTVHGIAHLHDTRGRTLFLRAYKNLFLGSTHANVHVEQQVRDDVDLGKAMADSSKQNVVVQLDLYVSYQPCHHSSGGYRSAAKHGTSCTRLFLDWWRKAVQPRDIRLVFRCCDLFRVHWEDPALARKIEDVEVFTPKTSSALEGMLMLFREQAASASALSFQAMNEQEWITLLRLCGNPSFAERITPAQWQLRHAHDRAIGAFLEGKSTATNRS